MRLCLLLCSAHPRVHGAKLKSIPSDDFNVCILDQALCPHLPCNWILNYSQHNGLRAHSMLHCWSVAMHHRARTLSQGHALGKGWYVEETGGAVLWSELQTRQPHKCWSARLSTWFCVNRCAILATLHTLQGAQLVRPCSGHMLRQQAETACSCSCTHPSAWHTNGCDQQQQAYEPATAAHRQATHRGGAYAANGSSSAPGVGPTAT